MVFTPYDGWVEGGSSSSLLYEYNVLLPGRFIESSVVVACVVGCHTLTGSSELGKLGSVSENKYSYYETVLNIQTCTGN